MPASKRTKTSKFGSSGRESHDSSYFYNGRLYEDQQDVLPEEGADAEKRLPDTVIDQIFVTSSEEMIQLPDSSIHLMITSPPYNVRKEYDENLTLQEYLGKLRKVFQETFRVLVPGGRACVNIANVGRKPYIPLNAHISQLMIDIGFLMRGEIIWDKAASVGSSTAWGSWMSASNPTLRDVHEYILVFGKGDYKRSKTDRPSTIQRDEFLEFTKSVWTFPTESARRVGHPAPFPVELPYRLIQLYTFEGEVILDPFIGSGSTAVAAKQAARHFVGYEINPEYAAQAQARLLSQPE